MNAKCFTLLAVSFLNCVGLALAQANSKRLETPASTTLAPAAESGVKSAEADPFPQGVLEEDGNLNLEAALNSYQSVIAEFDQQRPRVANTIFRLGEVYRKMGRLQEAKVQYARVLREFPDQVQLTRLSHQRLVADAEQTTATIPTLNTHPQFRTRLQEIVSRAGSTQQASSTLRTTAAALPVGAGEPYAANRPGEAATVLPQPNPADARQKELLQEEIKLVEDSLLRAQKKVEVGAMPPADVIPVQRELLTKQRELAAMDDDRARQRELLESEMKLVEQQRESIQRMVENGKAGIEDLNKSQRELLALRRKLAALDRPLATENQKSAADPSRTTRALDIPNSQPVETQSYPALLDARPNFPALPTRALYQQFEEARRERDNANNEMFKAEREARDAQQLLRTVQRSKPELLPAPASADPRYQELKKTFQDSVLSRRGSLESDLERIRNWVQILYIPELKSQAEAASLKLDELKSESTQREIAAQDFFERIQKENSHYQSILKNLRTIGAAKDQWALEQKKGGGVAVSESDIAPFIKGGMPKPVVGEAYQINPFGTPPLAQLAEPLGDFPVGHVIELLTAPPSSP